MSDSKKREEKKSLIAPKKKYEKPEIKSEPVLEAGLATVCNGTSTFPRKVSGGLCFVSKT